MAKYSWICLFCGRDLKDSEICPHRDDWGSFNLIVGLFSEEEKVEERKKLAILKANSKYPKCWEPISTGEE